MLNKTFINGMGMVPDILSTMKLLWFVVEIKNNNLSSSSSLLILDGELFGMFVGR